MNKDEQLRRLLRLKRHEQPDEGYFENFLEDFHAHQLKTLATQSAASLWFERVQTAFSALRRPVVAWGAVAAYAGVMVIIHAWPAPDHAANHMFINVNPGIASEALPPSLQEAPPLAPQPAFPGNNNNMIPAGSTILATDKSSSPAAAPPGRRRTSDQAQDNGDIQKPLPPARTD